MLVAFAFAPARHEHHVLPIASRDQAQFSAEFQAAGHGWKDLGIFEVGGDSLTVFVADPHGSQFDSVSADAVRIERLDSPAVTAYAWDHRNRLTRVEQRAADGTLQSAVDYVYDVFDRRIAKRIDANGDQVVDDKEDYLYDGANLLAELDDQGRIARRFLTGEGVDQLLAYENVSYDGQGVATAGNVVWTLTDHQGSIREHFGKNDQGTPDPGDDVYEVLHEVRYDAFGQPYDFGPAAAADELDIPQHYTGREYDRETGLQFNRARYYDPATRTFLSQDPHGFSAGDANLYRYAGNSPTNGTDPTGLYFESFIDGVSLGVGLGSLSHNVNEGNVGFAIVDAIGIAVDAVALAVPFVPGGASLAINSVRTTSTVLRTADLGANAYQAHHFYQEGDALGVSLSLVGVGLRGTQLSSAFHRNYRIVDTNPGALVAGSGPGKFTDLRIRSRFSQNQVDVLKALGETDEAIDALEKAGVADRIAKLQELGLSPTIRTAGGRKLQGTVDTFLTGRLAPSSGGARTITPYRDPARPGYNTGATHIDHAQARALGGSNDPSNLQRLAAETNLRKGGHEGQLKAYEQYLIRNGMSPQDARSVIQAEIDALRVSPPPRPMDPRILDQLPANPLDQGYPH